MHEIKNIVKQNYEIEKLSDIIISFRKFRKAEEYRSENVCYKIIAEYRKIQNNGNAFTMSL